MITLTSVDIIEYRAELAGNHYALQALQMIEDCEGDVDDAAIALALQAGQEPDSSDRWLEGVAKRWRHVFCQTENKEALFSDSIADIVQHIASITDIPPLLVTPVAIYLCRTGISEFCKPLEEKLSG